MWHKGINLGDCCALHCNPLKVALPAAAGDPMRGGWELYNQSSNWKRNFIHMFSAEKCQITELNEYCAGSVDEMQAS